jgi:hypothetical protein
MAEMKIQSPYLYLQSTGSTGFDGSTKGLHLRWDLLRNLGETHLPKGNLAAGTVNFNRQNDFVKIRRTKYTKRFPTIINFKTMAPDVVHDAHRLWVYTSTITGTVVYIWFRHIGQYDTVRALIDPATNTYDFIRAYGNKLIDVRVQGKLFFATEFEMERAGASPTLRAEALTVKENVPLSDVYVSCRKKWVDGKWCDEEEPTGGSVGDSIVWNTPAPAGVVNIAGATGVTVTDAAGVSVTDATEVSVTGSTTVDIPESNLPQIPGIIPEGPTLTNPPTSNQEYIAPCCEDGKNQIKDHSFEEKQYAFDTDFSKSQNPFTTGNIFIVNDGSQLPGNLTGSAQHKEHFLAVGGKGTHNVVWSQAIKVPAGTEYCFSGWRMRMKKGDKRAKILVQVEDTSGNILVSQHFTISPSIGIWQYFQVNFTSGKDRGVIIKIVDAEGVTAFYGLDNLWLCRAKRVDCNPRVLSENTQGIRFDANDAHVCELRIETYEDYMNGVPWDGVGNFSLTTDNVEAKSRLDNPGIAVHDNWPKYNDGARVNVPNYEDRWTNPVGVKFGIQKYLALSNFNPYATEVILGGNPEDGSMQVSYLDILRLVSIDYHVARMLGLGHIDPSPSNNDDDEFIYLAEYTTDGLLDDSNVPREVLHRYMTLPTGLNDDRLPEEPELDPVSYGVYVDSGQGASSITDAAGYTPDGLARFISLFIDRSDNIQNLGAFYQPSTEFCASGYTPSVFYGVEYRKLGEGLWRKPELAHDDSFNDTSVPAKPETLPIPNSGEETKPVFVHQEQEVGIHQYSSYGINWFSRASMTGNIVATNATTLDHAELLMPPSNFAAQLVQQESPIILTSTNEQNLLQAIAGADKTLIRVAFDYFHTHDINYPFADEVELFFRDETPRSVMGQVKGVTTDGTDADYWLIRTEKYEYNSTGTFVSPNIPNAEMPLYIGGVFKVNEDTYLIDDVDPSAVATEGPVFRVKKQSDTTVVPDLDDPQTFVSVEELKTIDLEAKFLALENMADPSVWSNNVLSTVIKLGDPGWGTTTESFIEEGEITSRDLRGIWEPATIVDFPEPGTGNIIGVYEITYPGFSLPNHQQAGNANAVNWYKGVVRIAKASDPGGKKKVLEVVKIENIGTALPLKIFAVDTSYNVTDPILIGVNVPNNFYPGYRAYLYVDATAGLNELNTLPTAGSGSRKTWMSARSCDTTQGYHSGLGIPAPMIAMEFIDPLPPEGPNGGTYATPPDFYFKSTYTFSMQFQHAPFSAAMYRANDDAILKALYTPATIAAIRTSIKALGEDPYFSDRWKNMISLDYVYDNPAKPFYDATGTNANDNFRRFPREAGNYSFPNPDKPPLFDGTQAPGAILEDVKNAIYRSFTPLTEQPLMYQFIEGGSYQPRNTPQIIRNNHGELLTPLDPEYDQAPMAKKLGGNQIQFTDFTLDGSSNNFYFYVGREIGNRGRMGDPGPIGGPIFLINTRPLDTPGIKRVESVSSIPERDQDAHVRFDINGYPEGQQAGQLQIYRANQPAEALSIRSMQLIKTVDLEAEGMLNNAAYTIRDNFENELVPYGDPLYYRIIALRKITDRDGNTDWAPSLPSKLLMLALVDSRNPINPTLTFTSGAIAGSPATVSNVVISWDTTTYNGTYYLEKMSGKGQWQKIYDIKSNATSMSVDLALTELASNVLSKEANGRPTYNRFRVMVQNSSGLFGLNEEILTI